MSIKLLEPLFTQTPNDKLIKKYVSSLNDKDRQELEGEVYSIAIKEGVAIASWDKHWGEHHLFDKTERLAQALLEKHKRDICCESLFTKMSNDEAIKKYVSSLSCEDKQQLEGEVYSIAIKEGVAIASWDEHWGEHHLFDKTDRLAQALLEKQKKDVCQKIYSGLDSEGKLQLEENIHSMALEEGVKIDGLNKEWGKYHLFDDTAKFIQVFTEKNKGNSFSCTNLKVNSIVNHYPVVLEKFLSNKVDFKLIEQTGLVTELLKDGYENETIETFLERLVEKKVSSTKDLSKSTQVQQASELNEDISTIRGEIRIIHRDWGPGKIRKDNRRQFEGITIRDGENLQISPDDLIYCCALSLQGDRGQKITKKLELPSSWFKQALHGNVVRFKKFDFETRKLCKYELTLVPATVFNKKINDRHKACSFDEPAGQVERRFEESSENLLFKQAHQGNDVVRFEKPDSQTEEPSKYELTLASTEVSNEKINEQHVKSSFDELISIAEKRLNESTEKLLKTIKSSQEKAASADTKIYRSLKDTELDISRLLNVLELKL